MSFWVLILAIGTTSAEIYKWVDDNGVVHFSDSGSQDTSETNDTEDPSSGEAGNQDNTPPESENPEASLPPDFFDILDESAEESEVTEEKTVEIYVTSW